MHCDTPSALYNPLRELAKAAADHGVLLILDAVSSIGADEILFDQWRVGVLVGGPQRALNTPPGLTILAVRKVALDRAREVGRETFCMNYFLWEGAGERRLSLHHARRVDIRPQGGPRQNFGGGALLSLSKT